MPRNKRPPDYYSKIAREISETTALKAGTIAFVPVLMATVSLPVRDVDGNTYSRRNGQYTLTMTAGDGNKLPSGSYLRQLLIFITTQSKITKSNEIFLGNSQAQFFRSMGLKNSGGKNGTSMAVRKQIKRLLKCNFLWETYSASSWSMDKISISNKAVIRWNLTRAESLECDIKLSDEFFTDIKEHAVPIDRRVIDAVSQYPMAIDIYCWLTYRYYKMPKDQFISWIQLSNQFGNTLSKPSHFKEKFINALKVVSLLYIEAKFSVLDKGLLLKRSKTHVPMREARIASLSVDNREDN